ncbi:MAG: hypothetical protein M1825_000908 [Sarcosagium campestre]|nr:MAG: hypothetical protein M1825_000908 [Sarcosagium campestre]
MVESPHRSAKRIVGDYNLDQRWRVPKQTPHADAAAPNESAAFSISQQVSQVWKLLWLYPDAHGLLKASLNSVVQQWTYSSALLLECLLQVQIIYQSSLRTLGNSDQDRVLLQLEYSLRLTVDEIVAAIQIFATPLVPQDADSSHRELQFRILTLSCTLLALHESSRIDADSYRALHAQITQHLFAVSGGWGLAESRGLDTHGFADSDLLLTYALDLLMAMLDATSPIIELPLSFSAQLLGEKDTVLLTLSLRPSQNYQLQKLESLQLFTETPVQPKDWQKPLQVLHYIALEAVSLRRYSRVSSHHEKSSRLQASAERVLAILLRKLEPLFQSEFERLRSVRASSPLRGFNMQSFQRNVNLDPPSEILHPAFGILRTISLLASEFGELDCFNSSRQMCISIIELCDGDDEFKMLRFKALEILLTVKHISTGSTSLEMMDLAKRRDRHPSISPTIQEAIGLSKSRYDLRYQLESQSFHLILEDLERARYSLPSPLRDYGIFLDETRKTQVPQTTDLVKQKRTLASRLIRRGPKSSGGQSSPDSGAARTDVRPDSRQSATNSPSQRASAELRVKPQTREGRRATPMAEQKALTANLSSSPKCSSTSEITSDSHNAATPLFNPSVSIAPASMTATSIGQAGLHIRGVSRNDHPQDQRPSRAVNGGSPSLTVHRLDRLDTMLDSQIRELKSPETLQGGSDQTWTPQSNGSASRSLWPPSSASPRDISSPSQFSAFNERPLPSLPQATSPLASPNSAVHPLSPFSSPISQRPSVSPNLSTILQPPALTNTRRSSRWSISSMNSSLENWKEPFQALQIQSVHQDGPCTVLFSKGNKTKTADTVALSPDVLHAAFVFRRDIEICSVETNLDEAGTPPATRPVMKLQKKEGQFFAAALSKSHLVAVTDEEVRICKFKDVATQGLPPCSTLSLERNAQPKCLAISQDSRCIAVGQRLQLQSADGRIQNKAVIQLYSKDLQPRERLECPPTQPTELPRNISFSADGQVILCSGDLSFHAWTKISTKWQAIPLGKLASKTNVGGSKGITSITPLCTSASTPAGGSAEASGQEDHTAFRKNYYIITSILSSVRDNTSTFISPLLVDNKLQSHYPSSNDFLHSASASPQGELACFLTSTGHLKVVQMEAGKGGAGLRMTPVANVTARISPDTPERAGKLGIRAFGKDFVIVGVDRHGKLCHVRIDAAERPDKVVLEAQMAKEMAISEKPALITHHGGVGNGDFSSPEIAELPDTTWYASPMRTAYGSEERF